MRSYAVVFVALLATPVFGISADFSDKEWKTRPVTKVINMLKDMQTQLQKEAETDEEMYEQMGCWCETNDREKTKAIADAERHIADLTAAIEGYTAKTSQLETEIEKLQEEVAKHTDMLSQATALRTKENSEFTTDEKDMMASAESLKGAVTALSGVHGDAAALPQESLMQLQQVLRHHMQKHEAMFNEKQHKTVLSVMQLGSSTVSQSMYTPQSGAINGILKQMKEEFETNIADSQTEEERAAAEYGELKSAKQSQISSASDLAETKTVELANTQDANAQAKQDLADTKKQLAADTEFLATVKDKCANADAEYEARQKVRTEEIAAVGEALGVLTSDESQQAFSRSQSFIQLSAHTRRMSRSERARSQAAKLLQEAAKKSGSSQLLVLAAHVKQDVFAEVKKQIDAMIEELKKTQKEETEQKEYCDSEIKANEKNNAQKRGLKADLEQKISDLTAHSRTLGEQIAALKASIAETNVEMKKASENREKENADFQVTVSDQKATQAILTKALDRLKAFYAAKLVQTSTEEAQPKQATYKKSGGAQNVMNMMQNIVHESEDVEKKALRAENESQEDYEAFIKDSNDFVAAAAEGISNKSEAQAQADKENVEAKADLASTIDTILKLGEYNVALHQDCDFLLKNYEVRQTSRADEIDALFNAKAIFSGANFGLFLQKQQ